MKTKVTIIFFLLVAASLRVNAQGSMLSSANQDEQGMSYIKAINGVYNDAKVYLHITVNRCTQTRTLAVERSIDDKNYKVIGLITIKGDSAKFNLAYYFTDNSPVTANLYYRLTDYSVANDPVSSETASVIPVGEKRTSTESNLVAFSQISNSKNCPLKKTK
jgi:hypothetical protein